MSKVKKESIDEQNDLTQQRIKKLLVTDTFQYKKERPTQNLSDLMFWVKQEFGQKIVSESKVTDLFSIINNIVDIDGSFVTFCEKNDVIIESLLIDSIASWNTPSETEDFMIQGIFAIHAKNVSFIHCAVFHKGNQFEDEISYFVIVDKDKYIDYVSFRNDFDNWQRDNESNILEVKVFGGASYEYEKNHYWDEIFLNEDLKKEIQTSINSFLQSKEKYESKKIPWKRGFLLYGPPGNGKTTLIHTLISEYDVKPVTINSFMDQETLVEAFQYAEENSPSLLFIEDIDLCFSDGSINVRDFLNLIDGLNAVNGIILILTTNLPDKLPRNLIERKSRIDKLWNITSPNLDMCNKYLKKWFGNSLKPANIKEISSLCIGNNFSYADLKEVYVSSILNVISSSKDQKLNVEDVKKIICSIVEEKNKINSGLVSSSKGKKFGFTK